jgi:phage-related protein
MSIVIPGPGGGGPVDPGGGSGGIVIPIPPEGSGGGSIPSPYAVFPLRPQISAQITKTFLTSVASFGDGWELRQNFNLTYTHADGMGGVMSHKGRWSFQIQFAGIDFPDVQTLWQFVMDRCAGWEPFFFYNPIEATMIDMTGASAVGRYLVRFQDAMISLEAFAMKLHRGQFQLIEVRA